MAFDFDMEKPTHCVEKNTPNSVNSLTAFTNKSYNHGLNVDDDLPFPQIDIGILIRRVQ